MLPRRSVVFSISRVGFNADSTRALLELQSLCSPIMCGVSNDSFSLGHRVEAGRPGAVSGSSSIERARPNKRLKLTARDKQWVRPNHSLTRRRASFLLLGCPRLRPPRCLPPEVVRVDVRYPFGGSGSWR